MARKVTMIPQTINPLTHLPNDAIVKRRVAGYARVSTEQEEQQTSYEAQVDYYTKYIKKHDEWEFVKVYTDEGISATSTAHRNGFNQMINDALDGKIDLIITKSVSRFARNTVDSLSTIRKLKEHNVECYFEKEQIWTFDGKGELLITIMSSLAHEESHSISENVTWGHRKRMSDGKVSLPYSSFLGYKKGADGLPEIVPEEAEIIRFIYKSYMEGQTTYTIAKALTEQKIPTPTGKEKWHASTIESILKNEKYKGSALLQKSFTTDFLTKKKKVNEGEVPQYYIEESHEPIISPEDFEQVQLEFARRKKLGKQYSGTQLFAAKLVCGDCGCFFGSKVWHSTSKYRRTVWQCNHKFKNGERCTTPNLYEEHIKDKFLIAMNRILAAKDEIIENCLMLSEDFSHADKLQEKIDCIELEKEAVSKKIRQLIQRHSIKPMKAKEYYKQCDILNSEYDALEAKQTPLLRKKEDMLVKQKFILDYAEMLRTQDSLITEFSETLWLKAIDHVTICMNGEMIFCFKDGTEIRV